MIKAVIFDLDGVLIDTEFRAINIKADLCRRYGLEWSAEDYYRTAARPFTSTIGKLFPDKTQEELDRMLKEYRSIAYVDMDYHRLAMPNAGKLLEGESMGELTEELFAYVLKVASGEAKPASEALSKKNLAIFKDGVTL